MNPLAVPLLEAALLAPLIGALAVSRFRNPSRAAFLGTLFTGVTLAAAVAAMLAMHVEGPTDPTWSLQEYFLGAVVFRMDALNAPLIPATALLHFLTALATPRTKRRRFSYSWSLFAESLRLAAFSCADPWLLVVLLSLGTIPPILELVNRRFSTRIYAAHMAAFIVSLIVGWSLVSRGEPGSWAISAGSILLMIAVLIRCGVVPAHFWLTDWLDGASFGNAILFLTPLTGLYAAVRLVLPVAPDWILRGMSLLSLITALYAAGMTLVQQDTRRFFAYLFLSHSALVLVGLEWTTETSLAGALCLWFSATLSLGGVGLTLRALEARFGRLPLTHYRGLYDQSPTLAVCFLLTGFACVGFPGTLGFVSTELLVDGTATANPWVGAIVALVTALNGIAVLRAYFLLFTGRRHESTISLGMGARERFAILTLMTLILGGGLFPQSGVRDRFNAAHAIFEDRIRKHLSEKEVEDNEDALHPPHAWLHARDHQIP